MKRFFGGIAIAQLTLIVLAIPLLQTDNLNTATITVSPARTAVHINPSPTKSSLAVCPPFPTPSPTRTPGGLTPVGPPAGDYGWYHFRGRVLASNGAPLAGATISYIKRSIMHSEERGIANTAVDGSFCTKAVYLHDTDTVTMTAREAGYIAQTVTMQQLPIWYAGAYNFELSPLTGGTETPTLSP